MCKMEKLKLARSCAVSLSNDPTYVLQFTAQKRVEGENNNMFAVAVSDKNEIKLYDQEAFCTKGSLLGHTGGITSVKFDILHPHIAWSTSLDGTLRMWDTQKKEDEKDTIISKRAIGYTALDISCDGSILAVATEQNEEEQKVFLEFWDIRKADERLPKCLATFEEIHSDDFTMVKFHPTNPKILVTGSTDGLITVLDLTTYDEEDALIQTLNTESSVSSMGFFGPSYQYLYALTHIETIMIWKYMEGDMLTSIIDLRDKCPKSNNIDYIINCHYDEKTERLFVIGGTHKGRIEILHLNLELIEPFQTLTGGHSTTIRCVLFSPTTLLTGAEDGMICSWVPCPDLKDSDVIKSTIKKKTSKEKKRNKPYKHKEEEKS